MIGQPYNADVNVNSSRDTLSLLSHTTQLSSNCRSSRCKRDAIATTIIANIQVSPSPHFCDSKACATRRRPEAKPSVRIHGARASAVSLPAPVDLDPGETRQEAKDTGHRPAAQKVRGRSVPTPRVLGPLDAHSPGEGGVARVGSQEQGGCAAVLRTTPDTRLVQPRSLRPARWARLVRPPWV